MAEAPLPIMAKCWWRFMRVLTVGGIHPGRIRENQAAFRASRAGFFRFDRAAIPRLVNRVDASTDHALQAPEWDAGLRHIYISGGHDYWGRQGEGRMRHGVTELDEVECVAGMGLRGDRYFGYRKDFKGQATFFDEAGVEDLRKMFKLPKLPASVFRRNFIVRGVELGAWLGKRFRFQGVEFEGSQECKPCHWMDRVVEPGTLDFMKQNFRGGLRTKIVTSGMLRVG